MTDVQGGEAAVVETTPKAAPEAAVSSQEQTRDWETEAKELGWVTQEEFKGPAEKWRPAEDFVRRGEEFLPFVKKQNKDLVNQVKELTETNERMSRMFEKTINRERENAKREIESLKAERKQAIKDGNDERAEQIDAQIDTLKEEAKPGTTNGNPIAGSPEHNALIKDFATANAWFVEEPDMASYAEEISRRNAELNDGISFADNMTFVVGAVRKKFPAYFKDFKETAAANGHAAVDAGGEFSGGGIKDTTYGLNKVELAQADKDIAAGLYKDRKTWAAAYRS